jgi:antitoxin component of RelBE/YafQ-DinJ toxin-antitoxin module
MSPAKTKFFQLRIEEELKERAEKAAQRKGLSLASLFRLYLIEGLEKDERKWGDGGAGKD